MQEGETVSCRHLSVPINICSRGNNTSTGWRTKAQVTIDGTRRRGQDCYKPEHTLHLCKGRVKGSSPHEAHAQGMIPLVGGQLVPDRHQSGLLLVVHPPDVNVTI